MQHAAYGDSSDRNNVLDFFKVIGNMPITYTWMGDLEIAVNPHLVSGKDTESYIKFLEAALRTLAGTEEIAVWNKKRWDGHCVFCSGPGAIAAACALRDEAGLKFS